MLGSDALHQTPWFAGGRLTWKVTCCWHQEMQGKDTSWELIELFLSLKRSIDRLRCWGQTGCARLHGDLLTDKSPVSQWRALCKTYTVSSLDSFPLQRVESCEMFGLDRAHKTPFPWGTSDLTKSAVLPLKGTISVDTKRGSGVGCMLSYFPLPLAENQKMLGSDRLYWTQWGPSHWQVTSCWRECLGGHLKHWQC